ncbi:hypothetical protein LV82_01705 [Albidovulum inexpectatum]|uniref:Uncharacterized protein n=1 Tax=Albidovulum inexpectatum TaxID=196587 RepID=A0A2S5JHP3_9RHOB|nr:hypothetical protein [Albidovulum inexpectatum]PPB80972.1 hypothetical protein LV82_01705 [Albidovulum inexpectatum]
MAERKRSTDGKRETEQILGERGTIQGQGREGGRLARQIGSKDEEKRAFERPAGATRVTKAIEDDGQG